MQIRYCIWALYKCRLRVIIIFVECLHLAAEPTLHALHECFWATAIITIWLNPVCPCWSKWLGGINIDIVTKGWFQNRYQAHHCCLYLSEPTEKTVSVDWWPMGLSQKRKLRLKEMESLRPCPPSPSRKAAWMGFRSSPQNPHTCPHTRPPLPVYAFLLDPETRQAGHWDKWRTHFLLLLEEGGSTWIKSNSLMRSVWQGRDHFGV